jgi:hypothetical protein
MVADPAVLLESGSGIVLVVVRRRLAVMPVTVLLGVGVFFGVVVSVGDGLLFLATTDEVWGGEVVALALD